MTESLRRLGLQPWLQASLASVLAFIVYLRTLAPTVMWYDMGEFATGAYVLGIAHNTGYPLLMLVGKLFTLLPVGDVAYRVNLMSATFGALTVLGIYLIVFQLTRSRPAASVAALTIAFTSTLWSNATWATSYDLNAFLTVLILYLLLRWRESRKPYLLYASALAFGLSLGNHRMILTVAPAMAYLIWYDHRSGKAPVGRRQLLTLIVFFFAGFSVNLYLPLRAAQQPPVNWGDPSDLERFLTMVVTGYARSFINPFKSPDGLSSILRVLTVFPIYEFTAAGLLLSALGAFELGRRSRSLLIATGLVVVFAAVMVSIYGIHNIFNYFQPIYLMFAIWLGAGVSLLLRAVGPRLSASTRLPFKSLTEGRRVLLATLLLLSLPLILFTRNFHRLDRSKDRNAADFAAYVLSSAEAGAVVLADFWSWAPLLYAQVVGGMGTQVEVSPALSDPGVDQEALLDSLLDAGIPVYVTVSVENSPRLQISANLLQLHAPYVIHYYPTHLVPLPEYKDLLVPMGAVYKASAENPDLTVKSVPGNDRLEASFGGKLDLLGFHIDKDTLRPGESFRATYYWSLNTETELDFWVDIQFTDEQGQVSAVGGLPIWLHSHWLGGGSLPTSDWAAGEIMRESYDGLVPVAVRPGIYYIRAFLYEDSARDKPVTLTNASASDEGALLGIIRVERRQ